MGGGRKNRGERVAIGARSAARLGAPIAEDATSRIFSGRVRSYKKGDLQALARVLLSSTLRRWHC